MKIVNTNCLDTLKVEFAIKVYFGILVNHVAISDIRCRCHDKLILFLVENTETGCFVKDLFVFIKSFHKGFICDIDHEHCLLREENELIVVINVEFKLHASIMILELFEGI